MYLIYFTNTYLDFRLPELDSLLDLFGYKKESIYDLCNYHRENPFLLANFPNDDSARQVASRAVLIKSIYFLWGESDNWESLFSLIQSLPSGFTADYYGVNTSWKLDVLSFGKNLTPLEQEETRLLFEPYMPFQGPVVMKNPMNTFTCILYYGIPNHSIRHIYFGTHVVDGQRSINDRYDLKKRRYIGPTSTCAELSFLMSNQIQAREGSFVWDCFVGTGSLLVAATANGSVCLGSDIDMRVLSGLKKGKKCGSIEENFTQYQLRLPELLRSDLSSIALHIRPVFDGILCDPPYGIRAGARKTRSSTSNSKSDMHSANTEIYDPDDVIVDLLDMAAQALCLGGRLAYLLPTLGEHTEVEVPLHPCLELVANSEDKLTLLISRRLITMKKVAHYVESKKEQYRETTRQSLLSHHLSFCDLMETTIETNRTEGKTRSQRKQRQVSNAEKWSKNKRSGDITLSVL